MTAAAARIAAGLKLAPLPHEGGFFRRLWVSATVDAAGQPAAGLISVASCFRCRSTHVALGRPHPHNPRAIVTYPHGKLTCTRGHRYSRAMRRLTPPLILIALILCPVAAFGDDHVAVVAKADVNYTGRKFGDGKPVKETFAYMQGRYFPGAIVDHSLERMSFRQLVSYLTPRLAEQQFIPAKTIQTADLLLLVHWGVTNPRVGFLEMTGKTTWEPGKAENMDRLHQQENNSAEPDAVLGADFEQRPSAALPGSDEVNFENLELLGDALARDGSERDLAQLLGYSEALRKLANGTHMTAEEQTLRFDLSHERYFVIIRAFNLRDSLLNKKPKLVWTVHMNISCPGNNFQTAMSRMSYAGAQFFGTTSDKVQTVRSNTHMRDTRIEFGEQIILGELK